MDFKQLESFVAIAKFKSFSKAADYLYLTQPTISSHIINLEKELKTTLINRTNKKISLTKAGEVLYDYAVNIINLKENAKFKLEEFKGKITGNIEIACSTIPEQYIIPDIICKFNKAYPDVTFNMFHYDSKQVVEGILHGEIDFGMVGAKIAHSQLKYSELTNDEIVLVTPCGEPYDSFASEINIENILQENFIFRERGSGTRALLETTLKKHKVDIDDLKIIAYIENTEAIKQCIRKGLGVSFLSKHAIEDEVKHHLLKAFKIKDMELDRNFYLVCHKYRSPSPLEDAFRKFVWEYFNA
ncbi:selenium metabolism-associated LysR family transcriptional regulator [Clostridium formicaceticum]|uniref:HTH-type transcriptional regulator CysL n=1 Tax=Clostridium formicaceticum TaxID=1497 RepID=A0AAC9RKQ8_9CLOT|nr:selenium metabolism-associated LysR family transcriptional regulator [Clostridium formicaceticum]AOY76654.1 LysR family transcriptional regulator [Clostridium formicaceticum]ARE87078.1 HTH-type transcriptional regulator CysL [Clostridium formicaceticum]